MPKVLKRYSPDEHEELWRAKQGQGRSRVDLTPYKEIVAELQSSPSLTIELEEDEEPKKVKRYLQQAAKEDTGRGLIFQRLSDDSRELTFRSQTQQEAQLFWERGQAAARALAQLRAQGTLRGRKKT